MNWLTLLFESDGSRGGDVVVLFVVEAVIKKKHLETDTFNSDFLGESEKIQI
jgi:predicted NUDIX family NTP pyrophosphohydrolase